MKANRLLTVLILLACALATVVALRPAWLGCRWSREGAGVMRPCLPPDELSGARVRRLMMKGLAVQQLAAGELTLFETAALFGQLNSLPPSLEHMIPPWPSGADEGERLCRQVIQWADKEWEHHFPPEEVKARVERLEQELQEHLAAHGGVRLPKDVPHLGIPNILSAGPKPGDKS
jgi:hypothetical protein